MRFINSLPKANIYALLYLIIAITGHLESSQYPNSTSYGKDTVEVSHRLRVLCTAALIDNAFETRKKEYRHSLKTLKNMGIIPYVVESCFEGEKSFLNDYSPHIYYSKSNIWHLHNKGVNEAVSILLALDHFGFNDDDLILKLTGRYYFYSDKLFKTIQQHNDCDAIVQYDAHGQIKTGCFVMRCKCLKEILASIDYNDMENRMLNFEYIMAKALHLRKKELKIIKAKKLGVIARIFGSGNIEIQVW